MKCPVGASVTMGVVRPRDVLHAGFRFDVTPMFYVGGKVSWFRGVGPQDDTGMVV